MTSGCDTPDLPRDEQYALVYAGIQAVAARCNGAITEDWVGFNGQDTKFGRRIASVPFAEWTEDVKAEAARIANTYQKQILTYTGVEIQLLPVVREAMGKDTNRQARDDARGYEKDTQAGRPDHVTVDAAASQLVFKFAYSASLVEEIKRNGRVRWSPADKTWRLDFANLTPEFVAWVISPELKFRISAEAQAILTAAASPTAVAAGPTPATVHGIVKDGMLVLDFPYNPRQKDAVKAAGARWDGAGKTWWIAINDPKAPAVAAAATGSGLLLAPDAPEKLAAAQGRQEAKLDRKAVLVAASRVSRPEEVSPDFLALVAEALR